MKAPEETEKKQRLPNGKTKDLELDHSGESCTGTDVNTGASSHTKRPLSPGGTSQDAESQEKHTKKPSGAQ